MKEYLINLEDTKKTLVGSLGDDITELEMALQIWQDLKKVNSDHEEDILILKILTQILSSEHNGEENIFMPDYYKDTGGTFESEK